MPKLRCILHVGTTKTGTSSIQESLYFQLKSPDFHYCSLGNVSGEDVIGSAFRFDPENFYFNKMLGLSPAEAGAKRNRIRMQLSRVLNKSSRRRRTVILSAENTWVMSAAELTEMANFIQDHGYWIDVYIYFREWNSWIESDYQQGIKQGLPSDELLPASRRVHIDYIGQLNKLRDVFGEHRVHANAFSPAHRRDHCIVKDFCLRAGIPFHQKRALRVNEGLSVNALKMLLAFRQYHAGYQAGIHAIVHNEMLFRRLYDVPGQPIRLSRSLLASYQHLWAEQIPEISHLLGDAFRLDVQPVDLPESITALSQLSDFTEESFDWLSRATGLPRIAHSTHEATLHAVGEQMDHLCYHPSWKSKLAWRALIIKRRLAHALRDV